MSTIGTVSGPAADGFSAAVLAAVRYRMTGWGHRVLPVQADDLDGRKAAGGRSVDAVVVVWPVDVGSLEAFTGLLSAAAVDMPVLALLVGTAPVVGEQWRAVIDRSGRAVQAHVIPVDHLRVYPDGGVVLDAATAVPLADLVDRFLDPAGPGERLPAAAPTRRTNRVSPVAGAPDLAVVSAQVGDAVLAPLLRELIVEYSTRYVGPSPYTTLTEVPASDFTAPNGVFLVLTEDGEPIAGGALRRYDAGTAEVKRVWTSSRHRRRGLALRLMAELERAALDLGYRRIHLTTGPRQPEAAALYLAAGYRSRSDPAPAPGSSDPLAFGKELVTGAGLVPWNQPAGADYYAVGRR